MSVKLKIIGFCIPRRLSRLQSLFILNLWVTWLIRCMIFAYENSDQTNYRNLSPEGCLNIFPNMSRGTFSRISVKKSLAGSLQIILPKSRLNPKDEGITATKMTVEPKWPMSQMTVLPKWPMTKMTGLPKWRSKIKAILIKKNGHLFRG